MVQSSTTWVGTEIVHGWQEGQLVATAPDAGGAGQGCPMPNIEITTPELASEPHTYDAPGTCRILIKVVDIFGNDTSRLLEHRV